MNTYVFQTGRDQQALVTIFDDGRATLAFRSHAAASWGLPHHPINETREGSARVSGGTTTMGLTLEGAEAIAERERYIREKADEA